MIESYILNFFYFISQCHPNIFNKQRKKNIEIINFLKFLNGESKKRSVFFFIYEVPMKDE